MTNSKSVPTVDFAEVLASAIEFASEWEVSESYRRNQRRRWAVWVAHCEEGGWDPEDAPQASPRDGARPRTCGAVSFQNLERN